MSVSLLEIFAAARAHAAPMAAESAGYLLLGVADHVISAPRTVQAEDVELSADGSVRLRPRAGAESGPSVELSVRALLARALELSSSVGPGLRRAAERPSGGGLSALVRELEVALIPVNRSAAKRALARLYRETASARDAGKLGRLLCSEAPPAAPAPVIATEPSIAPLAPVESSEEPLSLAAYAEPSPAPLPQVTESAAVSVRRPPPPAVELTLTPEPDIAVAEPLLTKPEPVVVRAKERASSTPRLGTVVTAQTLASDESERTERAPLVEPTVTDTVAELVDLTLPGLGSAPVQETEPELSVDVELELELELDDVAAHDAAPQDAALAAQPLCDPEPSRLPDVLTAMLEVHTGIDAEDAPTRIRDVVTELRSESLEPSQDRPLESSDAGGESLEPETLRPPAMVALPRVEEAAWQPDWSPLPVTPEPEAVDDAWLTPSSLEGVASAPVLFRSERADPALHEALTWDPGPVVVNVPRPVPLALLIAEPAPEPSPYAPAVLPEQSSDVAELVDSFHVSGAAEERELRSALKEMAGLELTPMPRYIEKL